MRILKCQYKDNCLLKIVKFLKILRNVPVFFCLETFETSEIKEYIDNNETALCPYCGIDSLVCFEDSSLPTKEELEEWFKHSFSPVGLSLSEIQKYKNRIINYTSLEHAKIFMKKESSHLFLLVKKIEINEDSKGFLVFDTTQKKQMVYEKELFLNNFEELSLEKKRKYYSNLKSCWNYRLVYSVKDMRLAIHECYYPKIGFTSSPSSAEIYINEVHPEKLKENLIGIFDLMLNAFAHPVVLDDIENDSLNETTDSHK